MLNPDLNATDGAAQAPRGARWGLLVLTAGSVLYL
jgi:hypothetical protein